MSTFAGWWFGTCFIFHNICDNPSHWLIIFFKMVKTTNQFVLVGIGSFIFHRCAGTRLDGWEPCTEIGTFLWRICKHIRVSYHIIPISSMYGIFTYIWVILFGQMLVNIPAPWFAYMGYHIPLTVCNFVVGDLQQTSTNHKVCVCVFGKTIWIPELWFTHHIIHIFFRQKSKPWFIEPY